MFFPFAPGFDSIYEPAMEEVEEALDMAKENLDHMQARGHPEAPFILPAWNRVI